MKVDTLIQGTLDGDNMFLHVPEGAPEWRLHCILIFPLVLETPLFRGHYYVLTRHSTEGKPHCIHRSSKAKKFGNLFIREILVTAWPYFRPFICLHQREPMWKLFYAVWEHATCYGISMLLTAVKTGYSLTSITWPRFGLRCRPIEVASFLLFFFLVLRWQVRSFQLLAGPILVGSLSNGCKDIWLK